VNLHQDRNTSYPVPQETRAFACNTVCFFWSCRRRRTIVRMARTSKPWAFASARRSFDVGGELSALCLNRLDAADDVLELGLIDTVVAGGRQEWCSSVLSWLVSV
jgi:hypothetical protein